MTLTEAQELRDGWMAAEKAVMKGQNYSIEGMSCTRVDAALIGRKIAYYDRMIVMLGRRSKYGTTTAKAVWS